jgi:hypothetical protein
MTELIPNNKSQNPNKYQRSMTKIVPFGCCNLEVGIYL